MATTATRPRNQQRREPPPPPPRETEQAVAVFQAPRLPFHPEIQKRFPGVGRAEWRTLTDALFPAAKSADAIMLALSYCKARKLDIFKRPVHIVPIWDGKLKREIESVWPGIGELRTTAMRTGSYAGMDPPVYGQMKRVKFESRVKEWNSDNYKDEEATVEFPEWCQITVYKMVQGQRVPFPGPKTVWLEYYSKKSKDSMLPNSMWERKSTYMIEKCAEAGALRRAFPDELGDQFSVEESGFFGAYDAKPVSAEILKTEDAKPAAPTRAQFTEAQPAEQQQAAAADRGVVGNGDEPPPRDEEHPGGSGGDAEDASGGEAAAGEEQKTRSWAIPADIVGQDKKLAAFNKLLMQAESETDIDAIEAANKEFLAKLGMQRKSETDETIRVRRGILKKAAD